MSLHISELLAVIHLTAEVRLVGVN